MAVESRGAAATDALKYGKEYAALLAEAQTTDLNYLRECNFLYR